MIESPFVHENILDFIRHYKNVFEDGFCEQAISEIKDKDWKRHSYYSYKDDNFVSHDNDLYVLTIQNELQEKIDRKIWDLIYQYICVDFRSDWFNGWNGSTGVRFNRYGLKQEMRAHCDHIHSMFDGEVKGVPTLTVLGCLNNDYEGGEFFICNNKKIELKANEVLIFPSNFMYPHLVTPVTSGNRYSFVSWVW